LYEEIIKLPIAFLMGPRRGLSAILMMLKF